MRKGVALLLILVFLIAACLINAEPVSATTVAENTWVSKAPLQQARSSLGVAVVNGKIYAIGGSTESGFAPGLYPSNDYPASARSVGTNEEYDPETDTWTYKVSMPTPRLAFGTAVYKNKIYCIGGQANGSYTGINEVYDPATNTWETKTPMPTSRAWVAANVVNGEIYLMGGYNPYPSTFNEVYDPKTDSWETKISTPDAPITDSSLASCVFDNRIILIGGLTQDQHYQLNQIYDTETDTWSAGAYPPSSLGGGAAATTTGAFALKRIYAIGPAPIYNPEGAPSYTNRIYDPRTNGWSAAADMPTQRFNFGIAVLNDTFYVVGGHTYTSYSYTPIALNEQYVPIGYGTPDPSYMPPDKTPPEVVVASPENKTYEKSDVPLNFTTNEGVSQMKYSIDGQNNVTAIGNATLADLSYGNHNLTVYATDEAGNTGASETVYFTVKAPFPVAVAVAASTATVAVVGIGLLVYFKKRKH
jgi:hypothetical protein